MSADSHHNSSLLVHFRALQGQNPKHIIDAFTRANSGPVTNAIATYLGALSHLDLRGLIKRLINTLSDRAFRITQHIKDHTYQTAFLVSGIILMMNPFTMAGFGSLGPVVGSIATAWQSSIGGSVAAGSAFAILQSMSMVRAGAIPVTGAAVVSAAAVVAAHQQGILRSAGGEVARWWGGDYGEPVKNWWKGDYGQPVKSWWGGTKKPVANWWGGTEKPVVNWLGWTEKQVVKWWGRTKKPVMNWLGGTEKPIVNWWGRTEKPVTNWWGQVTR